MNTFIQATPVLYGKDAEMVRKEVLQNHKSSKRNIERQKFLLDILDKVTKE